MKMITADYGNIVGEKSVKQQDAISIQLDGVEMIQSPDKNYQYTYANHYGHILGKFTGSRNSPGHVNPREYCAYMNHHWYVFRAKGSSAKLTVSDWVTSNEPGGPIGQEIMYNFIEIQPYLEN